MKETQKKHSKRTLHYAVVVITVLTTRINIFFSISTIK